MLGQVKPKIQEAAKNAQSSNGPRQVTLQNVPVRTTSNNKTNNSINFFNTLVQSQRYLKLPSPEAGQSKFTVVRCPKTNCPVAITKNETPNTLLRSSATLQEQTAYFLSEVSEILDIPDAQKAFQIQDIHSSANGEAHIRLKQYHQGIEVYGSEVILHTQDQIITKLNGRSSSLREIATTPSKEAFQALDIAMEDVAQKTTVSRVKYDWLQPTLNETKPELIIYTQTDEPKLAWQVEVIPNLGSHYRYFIDAHSGEILASFNEVCNIHGGIHHEDLPEDLEAEMPNGPSSAVAEDLAGNFVEVQTYEVGDTFYLIDATKDMFNGVRSSLPDDPVGAIWTIDAQNTPYTEDEFEVTQVTSPNNIWTNASAVSAHNNSNTAYEYFRQSFQRNSIDKNGGTIISIINVNDEDGLDMDNAFWNGVAMFYGNGDFAFDVPLARSLDVGGHEMTHGVIQSEANLEYFGESGAINESMADVFAVMMDREDWLLAEDIVSTRIYPSGALRDMENPNNGRARFGQNGWQPKHMDEFIETTDDNGGVHINSGIPNRAFVLFAKQVGKAVAEQVYYEALQNYLTRFSQFIDLRIAIIDAANAKYDQTVADAAAAAFDAVGILDGEETDVMDEVGVNDGSEYVLYSNGNKSALKIVTPDETPISDPLFSEGVASRPSITDDGSQIVFVADDNSIKLIEIDWTLLEASTITLSSEPIWRNVAISKDGQRLAAITNDYDNLIYVFDLSQEDIPGWTFELFNPTTAEGVNVGNVQFADVLDWDLSGEVLVYDAFNEIRTSADSIDYWDIGFLNAWDLENQQPGTGNIAKLFGSINQDVSIGNPTFAKNDPFLLAFDYIDEFSNDYFLRVIDIERNEQSDLFRNGTLNFPNFSNDDHQIIFDAFNTRDERVIGTLTLTEDKLSVDGNASVLIADDAEARWGVWFANGQRVLTTSTQDLNQGTEAVQIFPNPTRQRFTVETNRNESIKLEVFGAQGQLHFQQNLQGPIQQEIDITRLNSGIYFIKVQVGDQSFAQQLIKF